MGSHLILNSELSHKHSTVDARKGILVRKGGYGKDLSATGDIAAQGWWVGMGVGMGVGVENGPGFRLQHKAQCGPWSASSTPTVKTFICHDKESEHYLPNKGSHKGVKPVNYLMCFRKVTL